MDDILIVMKALDVRIQVPPERVVTLHLPQQVSPGEHRLVVMVDEESSGGSGGVLVDPYGICANTSSPMSFDDFATERRTMWGTSTDRELDPERA